MKREGVKAVTTNRVAEVAGISIGSVYQYFPDKRAIFVAPHERHIEQIDRMVESKLFEHTELSLDDLIRAMIDAHAPDPELYELNDRGSAQGGGNKGITVRLHGAFRLAISSSVLSQKYVD